MGSDWEEGGGGLAVVRGARVGVGLMRQQTDHHYWFLNMGIIRRKLLIKGRKHEEKEL